MATSQFGMMPPFPGGPQQFQSPYPQQFQGQFQQPQFPQAQQAAYMGQQATNYAADRAQQAAALAADRAQQATNYAANAALGAVDRAGTAVSQITGRASGMAGKLLNFTPIGAAVRGFKIGLLAFVGINLLILFLITFVSGSGIGWKILTGAGFFINIAAAATLLSAVSTITSLVGL